MVSEVVAASDPNRVLEAIVRIESPKLIARLLRIVRDVGRAEELAQDALVGALESWRKDGAPDNPGAWLMTAAKNKALNEVSRRKRIVKKHEEVERELELKQMKHPADALDFALDDEVGDDLLRLVFTSCHPLLSGEARVALTLRVVGGLSTQEIARAFVVPEATIAQRIVRAKKTLAESDVTYELPHGEALAERLASVLEVVYLVFNEGYSSTSGEDILRPPLVDEALRLGRILRGLMPDESEVHGLFALMALHASRSPSRVDASGKPVLLADQDRLRWDRSLIHQGRDALALARKLARGKGASLEGARLGTYAIQAAISECHAVAPTASETSWIKIASLYGELYALTGSPIVELNRAVAVAMAEGPLAGLELLDLLSGEPSLADYHLLFAARGDLLAKLSRNEEARDAFTRAASLTKNGQERALLLARAEALKS